MKTKNEYSLPVKKEVVRKRKFEKKVHLILGIFLLVLSSMLLPFSLTGFVVLNDSIKLNFLPVISFLAAIFEIYHGIKLK